MSKTGPDKDVLATGYQQKVMGLFVYATAYLMVAIVMTLNVFEGHSTLTSISSAIFRICGASRGPFAFAELFVNIRSLTDLQYRHY